MKKKKKNNLTAYVSSFLLVFILVLSLLFMGVRLLGYHTYPVLDSEMSPTHRLGSLAYVKNVGVKEIQSGTIISYRTGEESATSMQRVETVLDEGLRFRTASDNDSSFQRKEILVEDVLGSPDFSIPLLGYFAVLVRNKMGFLLVVLFVFLVIALNTYSYVWRKIKNNL